jgi:23S rRNA (cytosine1962-C5)-methyltransferase
MERTTLTTQPQKDYELLDSGGEGKLERYGDVLLDRPDPQALWPKRLGAEEWAKAQGRYSREGREGKWEGKNLPKEWPISFGGLTFVVRPTSFKHTGLFPEQLPNWEWASGLIQEAGRPISVLNLFGYTGGASLSAAQAGANVVHVDASKVAIAWARENAEASGLSDKPIRWIPEDAKAFVEREQKRGNKYDLILMDPPAFGHGPDGELWKIEEDLVPFIESCAKLLSDKPLGMLINGYAAGYSPLAFAYNLEPIIKTYGGSVEYGDLSIQEKGSGRSLPCGIFARWRA